MRRPEDIRVVIRAKSGAIPVPVAAGGASSCRSPMHFATRSAGRDQPAEGLARAHRQRRAARSARRCACRGATGSGLDQVKAFYAESSGATAPAISGIEVHFSPGSAAMLTIEGKSERLLMADPKAASSSRARWRSRAKAGAGVFARAGLRGALRRREEMNIDAATALTLVIGNKNYSSWSLRPWLLLRHHGIAFDEVRLPLDTRNSTSGIARWSPSGRVPVLHHGELVVWDSLAICEYVNEAYLDGRGWPRDAAARALARAVSAEMHSGFQALRDSLPLNCRRRADGIRRAARSATRRRTHHAHLARMSRMCGWRRIPVRRLHDRRCDVCAGRFALPHVRRRSSARSSAAMPMPC